MKNIGFKLLLILFLSCSSYSDYAKFNQIGKEKTYTKIYNPDLNLSSLTFGDFEYAFNQNDFKKLTGKSPKFKNILLYAVTEHPKYEYYVLINPNENEDFSGYLEKDTLIDKQHYKLIISEMAPKNDVNFIMANFKNN